MENIFFNIIINMFARMDICLSSGVIGKPFIDSNVKILEIMESIEQKSWI